MPKSMLIVLLVLGVLFVVASVAAPVFSGRLRSTLLAWRWAHLLNGLGLVCLAWGYESSAALAWAGVALSVAGTHLWWRSFAALRQSSSTTDPNWSTGI